MKKTILLLAIVSFSVMAGGNENTINANAMIEIKKNSEQYINICKAVESHCKPGTVIWKGRNSNDYFYLISSKLQLVKVRKDSGGYSNVNMWDFSKENNNEDIPDDELTKGDVYIYPALYPLNKEKLAVALVSKWSTSYSGGGREEEYANFMMINDDGSYQLAFKSIPFSSKKMIRACFTEDDYAKKSHCHDENWSILNLKITDEAKEFYAWKFITKSYDWPAFKEKTSAQVKTSEIVVYPFQSQPQSNK